MYRAHLTSFKGDVVYGGGFPPPRSAVLNHLRWMAPDSKDNSGLFLSLFIISPSFYRHANSVNSLSLSKLLPFFSGIRRGASSSQSKSNMIKSRRFKSIQSYNIYLRPDIWEQDVSLLSGPLQSTSTFSNMTSRDVPTPLVDGFLCTRCLREARQAVH